MDGHRMSVCSDLMGLCVGHFVCPVISWTFLSLDVWICLSVAVWVSACDSVCALKCECVCVWVCLCLGCLNYWLINYCWRVCDFAATTTLCKPVRWRLCFMPACGTLSFGASTATSPPPPPHPAHPIWVQTDHQSSTIIQLPIIDLWTKVVSM